MTLMLRRTRRLLIACAVSLLAYCGFVLMDARIFQKEEDRQLQSLLTAPRKSVSPTSLETLETLPSAATSGLIGRMDIPRIGISSIVMEGTSSPTLRRALGHI